MKKASRKFAAHNPAATQPGPVSPKWLRLSAADERPEDESQPERHPDEPHPL